MGCTSSQPAVAEVVATREEPPRDEASTTKAAACPDAASVSTAEAGAVVVGEPLDTDAIKLAACEEENVLGQAEDPTPELDEQEQALQRVLEKKFGSLGKPFRPDLTMASLANKGNRRPSSVGIGVLQYVGLHEQQFAALEELDQQPGWTFKKKEQGVNIYTLYDQSEGLVSFKGVADFACKGGIADILQGFFNPPERVKFDEMCMHGEVVEQVTPYYRVVYHQFKAPQAPLGIIKDRDAVLLARFRFNQDGSLLCSVQSTVHKNVPENPNFVRLNFICGGYLIRPQGESLQVTYLGTIDPKGWVPTFVKNIAAWKQPLVLAKYKAAKGV
uniref:START domain-containing protein n=1 Tax=Alexandrium catenella TaxID=2925 RepID=A0A7S1LBV1_ALECA